MGNVMKVTKETRCVEIVRAAFPARQVSDAFPEVDRIEFGGTYRGGGLFSRGTISGIQLSTQTRSMRRVMVKNDEIDLDAIRATHAELIPIQAKYDEERRSAYDRAQALRDKLRVFNTAHAVGDEDDIRVYIRPDGTLGLHLKGLSENQAASVLACFRQVKHENQAASATDDEEG